MRAHYYGEISFIDYNLGRLLTYLDEEGILEETLIIYTADHGEMLGDYDCFGKRCFLDPAVRIPLIMRYPGCDKGTICPTPVSLIDIMPTILEYAGIESDEDYCGESLFDLSRGESVRETVFSQYEKEGYANYMAVDRDFKYIYSAPDDKEILFDLKTDPGETRNKAYSPSTSKKPER
jgi:arylsulfatase